MTSTAILRTSPIQRTADPAAGAGPEMGAATASHVRACWPSHCVIVRCPGSPGCGRRPISGPKLDRDEASLTRLRNDLIDGRYPIAELSRLVARTEADHRLAGVHARGAGNVHGGKTEGRRETQPARRIENGCANSSGGGMTPCSRTRSSRASTQPKTWRLFASRPWRH